jgi:general secretion pathway protein D
MYVTDVVSRITEIDKFMKDVSERNEIRLKTTPAEDPFMVKSYNTSRDVTNAEFRLGLNSILSGDGKVVTNPDQNTVVVYDRASRFRNIDMFFAMIDTEPQQVLLTSKLVEITLDNYMGYGLQWFTDHGAQNLNDGRFTGSSFGTSASTVGQLYGAPSGFGPFVGTFISDRVNVTLQMLANDGKVQTLIQPTSLVSNKKTARISVGQEVPYLQTSATTGAAGAVATAGVAFKEIATVLEVTPTILDDGLMRLDVRFTVKEQIGSVAIEQNDTPILSNRESTSNVFVRDGETLVIGGLIRQRDRDQENGLPFLKDIPLLGFLFKSKNVRKERTDLMFFLRPSIITNGPRGKGNSRIVCETENRPLVWDDDDLNKLKLVGGEAVKIAPAATKPTHYDTAKRPKTAKDVDPN